MTPPWVMRRCRPAPREATNRSTVEAKASTLLPALKGLTGKAPKSITGARLRTLQGLFDEKVLSSQVTGMKHDDTTWQLIDVGHHGTT